MQFVSVARHHGREFRTGFCPEQDRERRPRSTELIHRMKRENIAFPIAMVVCGIHRLEGKGRGACPPDWQLHVAPDEWQPPASGLGHHHVAIYEAVILVAALPSDRAGPMEKGPRRIGAACVEVVKALEAELGDDPLEQGCEVRKRLCLLHLTKQMIKVHHALFLPKNRDIAFNVSHGLSPLSKGMWGEDMRAQIDVGRKIADGCRSLVFTVGSHTELAWETQRLRRRIFVEGLGWPLAVDRWGRERDQFDRKDTIYGAVVQHGEPVACWRLLQTDRPYLLGEVFPHLAGGQSLPRSPAVWEISRFGVDPLHQQPDILTRELLGLMMRFAVQQGAETIVAVSDEAFQRVLTRNRLKIFRYPGIDHSVAGARGAIVAGGLHLAEQTHPSFRKIFDQLREAA